MMAQFLRIPAELEHPEDAGMFTIWCKIANGVSLIVESGVYTLGRTFDADRIAAAQKYYPGGYELLLTAQEVTDLTNAGFGEFITTE